MKCWIIQTFFNFFCDFTLDFTICQTGKTRSRNNETEKRDFAKIVCMNSRAVIECCVVNKCFQWVECICHFILFSLCGFCFTSQFNCLMFVKILLIFIENLACARINPILCVFQFISMKTAAWKSRIRQTKMNRRPLFGRKNDWKWPSTTVRFRWQYQHLFYFKCKN